MREYYLLRSDGSSVFAEAHCKDFIWHCYYQLLDSEEHFIVVHVPHQNALRLFSFPYLPKKLQQTSI